MTRRVLTQEEMQETKCLKKIWEAKKNKLHLTQEKAAKAFGYANQTAVSQYLNGRIALNLETVMRFCALLDCNIEEVSPRFYKMLPKQIVTPRIEVSNLDELEFVIAKNNVMQPTILTGDMMVIDRGDLSGKPVSLPTGRVVAVFVAESNSTKLNIAVDNYE